MSPLSNTELPNTSFHEYNEFQKLHKHLLPVPVFPPAITHLRFCSAAAANMALSSSSERM